MSEFRVDKIYYFILALYLIPKYIEATTIYYTVGSVFLYMKVLRFLSYFLILCLSVFHIKYSRGTLWRYIIFMILLGTISMVAGSVTILFSFFFIFAARDIPTRKIIRFVVILQSAAAACIVTGSLLGLIPNWTYVIDGRFRQSLGYFYPNRISTIYFFIVIACCYLFGKKINLLKCGILEMINLVIYYFTNTRTAFALTTLALIVFLLIKYYKKPLYNNRITRFIYIHSLYIIVLICIGTAYIYTPSNALLFKINSFLSNRLLMGHNALLENPITLFGQKISWYGFGGLGYIYDSLAGEYNAVDCSYIKILLDNGVIMLLIAVAGYMFASYTELKKGNRYFCLALLFISMYCMIEPSYIEIGFNTFVVTICALITKRLVVRNNNGRVRTDLIHLTAVRSGTIVRAPEADC